MIKIKYPLLYNKSFNNKLLKLKIKHGGYENVFGSSELLTLPYNNKK